MTDPGPRTLPASGAVLGAPPGQAGLRPQTSGGGQDADLDVFLTELAGVGAWTLPEGAQAAPLPAPGRREPLFVHHLPREDRFVGRAHELDLLQELYEGGRTGIVAVVGIGGAGKSVLLDRFLRTIDAADGLLVWSFYFDEDAERFLAHAFRYVTGGNPPPELRGRALAEALCGALKTAGRVVLVLDGVERAQRDDGRIGADAMRDVLERLALGWGRALALVTTRLSLVDLQHYRGDVYREVRLGELSSEDAAALLARVGVRGTEADLAALSDRFGGHALTISLLGTALARFYEGDPTRADEIIGEGGLDMLDETGKLGRVLAYYEQHLAPAELAVLKWMTALPRGATLDFLERFVLHPRSNRQGAHGLPSQQGGRLDEAPHSAVADIPEALHGLDHGALRAVLGRLIALHLIQADTRAGLTEYGVHAAIKAHFYERMLASSVARAHEAAYRALDPLRKLAERPAHARPVEQDELDRVEDVVFHALRAGRGRHAYELYRRFFGYEHLGAKLGAYALGERVVRRFFPEGDPARPVRGLDPSQRGFLVTELGLFLRQLGEVAKAGECHALVTSLAAPEGEMPVGALLHLAHDRLLQGSFGEVQWFADQARRLAGADHEVERCAHLYLGAAHTCLGELDKARLALEAARRFGRDDLLLVTVRVDLNLRVGRPERADNIARDLRRRISTQSFHEDHVACDLLLAECAFALGSMDEALQLLASADLFAKRSSWRHALCRIHRLRARIAHRGGDLATSAAELDIGQRMAERYGFASLLIDLLVLRGELALSDDPTRAAALGRQAFQLATDPACRYRFGQADALEIWGRAAAGLGDRGQARVVLKQALRMRTDLGNADRAGRTEQFIAAL